ncbi:MAG: hypothetical protein HYU66_28300 [Armatimonadetes bacterium]|nr:hypothetical protein [Armatimonadota bacterium]
MSQRWTGLAVACLLLRGAFADATGESILEQHVAHLGSGEYTASQTIVDRQSDGQYVRVSAELRHRGSRELTRYVGGTPPYLGVVLNDDGKRYLMFLPSDRRGYVYPSREGWRRGRGDPMQYWRDRYDVDYVGDEQVAGRRANHLRLCPKTAGRNQMDFWIDPATWISLRFRLAARGQVSHETVTTRITYNPGLRDGDLHYDLPDGVPVVTMPKPGDRTARAEPLRFASPDDVRRRFGIRLMQPTYLPTGYRRDTQPYLIYPPMPGNVFRRRVSVMHVNGNDAVVLTLGGMPIDRHEGDSGEADTEPREVKPGVFFWVKEHVRLALIGPRGVDSKELRRSADSVAWCSAANGRCTEGRATLPETTDFDAVVPEIAAPGAALPGLD